MRILIYGAGVIGCLYGAYLSHSGCEVSMIARGHRLEELRKNGLLYWNRKGIQKAEVRIIEQLEPGDRYDYIFLTVRAGQLHHALEQIKDNISLTIVTMVNSLDDFAQWEDICGKGRILPAFPGAGGSIRDGILDAGLTPRLIQPTTFAEINGCPSERVDTLKKILTQAGIPCQIVPDMHVWQICHLAMVVPLADAAAGVGLLGKSTVGTVASAVLGAGALGCGAFTAWCIYANGQFSYDGKRKLSKQIVEGTADYITLPEGGIGLDMGCGSGALTIACAKRNLQRTMVGIDRWGSEYAAFSKDLREQNAEAEGVSNVSFQKGDACKLDFADETFDAVTSNYVYCNITGKNEQAFHAFPDKDTAFRETFRVLKPGGIFCGCFYIAEQNKQTDWFINHLYIPKGFFAPPFDTVATLYKRLSSLYEEVNLETVESMACFTCRKGE